MKTSLQWLATIGWIVPLIMLGCGREEDPRGQRVGVRGTVVLDDKPLNKARIVFRAAEGENKITATGRIVNGFYEIPAERGPLVGKVRVEIQSNHLELEEFETARAGNPKKRVPVEAVKIPASYNTQSKLIREIKADESQNVFSFELKSKP